MLTAAGGQVPLVQVVGSLHCGPAHLLRLGRTTPVNRASRRIGCGRYGATAAAHREGSQALPATPPRRQGVSLVFLAIHHQDGDGNCHIDSLRHHELLLYTHSRLSESGDFESLPPLR